jgi:hypothetical protein
MIAMLRHITQRVSLLLAQYVRFRRSSVAFRMPVSHSDVCIHVCASSNRTYKIVRTAGHLGRLHCAQTEQHTIQGQTSLFFVMKLDMEDCVVM